MMSNSDPRCLTRAACPGKTTITLCLAMFFAIGPTSALTAGAQGRSVAFVSNVDPKIEPLARGWVGQQDEIEYIVTPRDLDDLARKLKTLGRAREISNLVFIGHGGDTFFEFLTDRDTGQKTYLNEVAVRSLAQRHPDLADAFAPGARVLFVACGLGKNDELMRAVGDAFLRTNGGTVVANRGSTVFEVVRDLDGIVLEWIDHPDRFRNRALPSDWKSVVIEAAPRAGTPPQGIAVPHPLLDRFVGTWAGEYTRLDNNATGSLSTTFTYDAATGTLGGWHYDEQYVMRDVKVAGNSVTFWHDVGSCRADHDITVTDFGAKRASSTYRVTCADGSSRSGRVEYR